jgi:predicted DNA-binding transcriptional regulator AlpA
MLRRRLRYRDLVELGVVHNRVSLSEWIKNHGFPAGIMQGPNMRTWGEDEVEEWIANRPVKRNAPHNLPPPRKRKAAAPAAATDASAREAAANVANAITQT